YAVAHYEQADRLLRGCKGAKAHVLAEAACDLARCRLAAGDVVEFRRLAADAVARFADGPDAPAAAVALSLPLLAEEKPADVGALLGKAAAARARFPESGRCAFAHALALYRADKHAEAAAALEDARNADWPTDDAACKLLRTLIA